MTFKKYHVGIRPSFGDTLFRNIVITCATVFVVFPYYWMVLTSLKPARELMLSPTIFFPSYLEFSNYLKVWTTLPLVRYIGNSVFVAVCTTAICVMLSTMAGYSLSCFKTKIRNLSISLFLFTQLVPFMLPFISFYFMMFKLRLTNTYTGLIMAYSIWGIPFCTLMIRGYFTQAIHVSILESARIDGCSKWGTFTRIALPLVTPGLVATAIFSFILAWNDFIWASVMLTDQAKKPVSIGVYDYIGQWGSNVNIALTMATAVLITIPTMILFSFLQKNLVSGLSAGAVKG